MDDSDAPDVPNDGDVVACVRDGNKFVARFSNGNSGPFDERGYHELGANRCHPIVEAWQLVEFPEA